MEERVIMISSKNSPNYYVNQARIALETNDTLELQGIASSIIVVINTANRLCELDYASMLKFQTGSFEDNQKTVYKAFIRLAKSPNFDRVNEEYKNSRTYS